MPKRNSENYRELVIRNAEHIKTINSEMGEIRDLQKQMREELYEVSMKVTRNYTDLAWIKKAFWLVAGSSIATLVGMVFSLLK